MQSARLTWKDPSGPMTGVEIAMRVQGAPDFTVLEVVSKGAQSHLVPDLVPGTYDFRAVVINGNKRSAEATASGTVEYDEPGSVTEFVVAFE